jgi:hypothetical protein
LHSLSYQPRGKALMRDNPPVRKLLIQYITGNNVMAYNNLYLVANLELPEGVAIAKKILESQDQGYVKAMALGVLAKVGNKDNIPDILPYLDRTDVIQTMNFNRVEVKTQMRDVALASLVQVSGLPIADYNFDYLKMFGNGANFNVFTSPGMLGFSDDGVRNTSIKKWKDWYDKEKGKK